MIGIYKITSPTGRIYIGQSVNIKRRFVRYKSLDCKEQPRLYRSLLKYGIQSHLFEVVILCDREELNDKERYYQELFMCIDKGLNCNLVETSEKPRVVSAETIEKIRKIHLGRVDSPEVRKKRALALTGLKRSDEQKKIMAEKRVGRLLSEQHKKNISKSGKGRVCSIETREKISVSSKGKKMSQECKDKLSLINKNRCKSINEKISKALTGNKIPEETKKKMSDSHKLRFLSIPKKIKPQKTKRKKQVICTITKTVYDSISQCAILNGYKRTTLAAKLNGDNKNDTSFMYLKN